MRAIQNWAAGVFLVAVCVLSVISVMGVWDFFTGDVITKSFETIGLLGAVAALVIVAGRFLDPAATSVVMPHPVFQSIRQSTLGIVIVCAVLLALLGVLSIWQVVAGEILHESLSSLAILGFGALITVIVCLEREGKMGDGEQFSIGRVVAVLLVIFLLSPVVLWVLAMSAFQ